MVASSFTPSFTSNFPDNYSNSSMTSGHETVGQEPPPLTFPYYSTNQVNSVNNNSNSMYRCTIPQIANQPSPLNSSICRRNVSLSFIFLHIFISN
ncbi:unnamed protein product [Wuchereria bancrofti]|uniref:Uncharacterized protein n=1 Tax=Wuchereria bancrofti TaxID=6293 RepID=A0A3P7EIR0_WUCBA|nr:unnamed protein product [Wuchereria bancrofti]